MGMFTDKFSYTSHAVDTSAEKMQLEFHAQHTAFNARTPCSPMLLYADMLVAAAKAAKASASKPSVHAREQLLQVMLARTQVCTRSWPNQLPRVSMLSSHLLLM